MNPCSVLYALVCASAAASQGRSQPSPEMTPPQTHQCTDLADAAGSGHMECVKALLADPGVDPTADSYYGLCMAAENGHAGCVKLLLGDERVNPASCIFCVLGIAAQCGCLECVQVLLADPRVDPAGNNNGAICSAANHGHVGCLKVLLADPRVNPAANGNYALRKATKKGHTECVKLLLADPRVDPGAIRLATCHPTVRSLVLPFIAYKDGDLDAFKQMNLATLPEDELDIFISRNRSFPEVQHLLFDAQLAHLAVPEAVHDDPAYKALVDLARSRGVWRTVQLRELTEAFIRVKNIHWLPGECVAIIVAHAYDLVP